MLGKLQLGHAIVHVLDDLGSSVEADVLAMAPRGSHAIRKERHYHCDYSSLYGSIVSSSIASRKSSTFRTGDNEFRSIRGHGRGSSKVTTRTPPNETVENLLLDFRQGQVLHAIRPLQTLEPETAQLNETSLPITLRYTPRLLQPE